LVKKIAVRGKILAIPNQRSLHDKPVPTGGGIAIVLIWYIGISIFYFTGLIERSLYFALLCGILLAIVSLIDDLVGLKTVFRLIIQFITAIAAFIFIGGLRPLILPEIHFNYNFIVYPIAVTGMVWFINLFNFMDGIDGFAALEAMTIGLVLYFMSGDIVCIVLAACVAGFLYWNWPKAKIFMGDVGSTQLGFILVVLGVYFHNTFKFSILNWIMLSSPFWFDATLTLYRRWRNRENIGEAHFKHAYQRAVQSGFTHLKVNIWLIIINVLIFAMILLYREIKFLQIPVFILTLLFFYVITRLIDKKVPFNKT